MVVVVVVKKRMHNSVSIVYGIIAVELFERKQE
jgi:hypothetical protein